MGSLGVLPAPHVFPMALVCSPHLQHCAGCWVPGGAVGWAGGPGGVAAARATTQSYTMGMLARRALHARHLSRQMLPSGAFAL